MTALPDDPTPASLAELHDAHVLIDDLRKQLAAAAAAPQTASVPASRAQLNAADRHEINQPLTAARAFVAATRHRLQAADEDDRWQQSIDALARAETEISRAASLLKRLRVDNKP